MKQFSPIVLFFMLLLISCNREKIDFNAQDLLEDSINQNIKKSQNSTTNSDRLKYSNTAYLQAMRLKKDSLLYNALYNKIQTDLIFQKNDSIHYYFENLKKISTRESYKGGYYYLKGYYFMDKNIDSSYVNYDKSQRKYLSVKQFEYAGYSLFMMAEISRTASDYANAENILTEAYRNLKTYKNYHNSIYNSFGLLYHSQGDYEKALQYYHKTLDITTEIQQKNVIKNNIALVYTDKKDYRKSIQILDSLNASPSLTLDPVMKAKVLSNLGYAFFLSKKGNGISYLKQAETIQDSIADSFGRLNNYLKLSEAYQERNKSISKNYAFKAYELSNQLHNGDDKLRALQLMTKATDSKHEADRLFTEYIALNDSIKTARQTAKNQFAKIRYDSSEAEKLALLAKAESAESRLQAEQTQNRNIMLLVLVAVLITSIIFWSRFMKKKNTIDKLKASYAAETRISRKVHDELANDIYNAMMFTNMQDFSSDEKKERLLGDLDNVYKRTRDISKENASIETGDNFPLQLMGMLSEYQNETVNVLRSGIKETAWDKIEEIKKITVYRVLQELMVNMAKHSQATLCLVNFKSVGKNIEVYYSDDGLGMGNDKIIFKNGLANAENRIQGISGSLTFDPNPEKGVKITIIFPA